MKMYKISLKKILFSILFLIVSAFFFISHSSSVMAYCDISSDCPSGGCTCCYYTYRYVCTAHACTYKDTRVDCCSGSNCGNTSCGYGSWQAGACGGGSCPYNKRQYTRTRQHSSYHYCSSHNCHTTNCSSTSKCESDSACECQPHASIRCYNDSSGEHDNQDRYYYDSCGAREEKAEDCGNGSWFPEKYRCSGDTRQRWYTRRGCYQGSGWSGCYDDRGYWADEHNCNDGWYGVPAEGFIGEYSCRDNRWRTEKWVNWWCEGAGECKWSSEWRNIEDCGTSYWTNEYRCSGRNKQRKYINRGCSGSSCYANSQWKNVEDCGTTSYGSWTFYCSNNDKWKKRTVYNRGCADNNCYYYTSTQNEFVQDCGDISCGAWSSWYCDDNIKKRERTCTGGYCEGSSCKSGTYTEYDTEDCGSDYWTDEYQCSDNIRQRKYVNRGCSDGSCYNWTEWKDIEDCESTSYGPWGNYCSSDDVWKKRTITHGFCSGGSCTTNTSTQNELVEDCGESSWVDPAEYRCSGSWKQRKWINRGCLDASCYATSEWKNEQNCAETCFPGALAEGCEGGTYSCVDGECTYPISQCIPRQFTSSGTACKCNEGRKTILKACDGSGSCLDVEEVCDIQCGADLACQGLKPGDAYPGKPGRTCCGGKWGLPKWREIVPW